MTLNTDTNTLVANKRRYRVTRVRKFNRLPAEIKQKAIEHYCYINVNHNWWDFTHDDAKEVGLKITGFDLNGTIEANITGDPTTYMACAEAIVENHGKDTDTYKLAAPFFVKWYLQGDGYEERGLLDEYLEEAEEFEAELKRCYLKMLQREYEYLTSEEAVVETLIANDYEFDNNGKIA